MSKKKVIHYMNQFFAGIGGEEKAGIPPEIRKEKIGPGAALEKNLGDDYEIVATVICGDNYFGEHLEEAKTSIINMMEEFKPDLFIAGPAFNAGRYGVACGGICVAVEEHFKIPVVTAMYKENPGVDMYRKDLYIIETKDSAADMRNAIPKVAALSKKLVNGEEILAPSIEGYFERGIRVNYFNEVRGSTRAVDLLVRKIKGEKVETEYPMPFFDKVPPAKAIKDITKTKVAFVTSGGIVPVGNPDRIESSSATKYGVYSIKGKKAMDPQEFMTVHGGYDRAFVLKNPNLVIPLDVMREIESEGGIGELADYFITTTGTGTSTGNAKHFGEDFVPKLLADGVQAVILTST